MHMSCLVFRLRKRWACRSLDPGSGRPGTGASLRPRHRPPPGWRRDERPCMGCRSEQGASRAPVAQVLVTLNGNIQFRKASAIPRDGGVRDDAMKIVVDMRCRSAYPAMSVNNGVRCIFDVSTLTLHGCFASGPVRRVEFERLLWLFRPIARHLKIWHEQRTSIDQRVPLLQTLQVSTHCFLCRGRIIH